MTRSLMKIEAEKCAVERAPIDVRMLANLRETARVASTHYSTRIEGNRLTLEEVERVVEGRVEPRGRDEMEVEHYYQALAEVERLGREKGAMTEEMIKRLAGRVLTGRGEAADYRESQSVIRDSAAGAMVYLPPEAKDVPGLMKELVDWVNVTLLEGKLPAAIVAGLAHCQFVTIHPYFDGNGRTARLLATLILHRTGYGLKGICSLDEYYARDLQRYYEALTVGPSHNYYLERAEADLTAFLEYFCAGMSEAVGAVRRHAEEAARRGASDVSGGLRALDPRERRALELLGQRGVVSMGELADYLNVSERTMGDLCRRWVKTGLLRLHDPSRKRRLYGVGERYAEML